MLTTARLHLREFVEDDWRAVQAYQSDPRYLRFYDWTARPEAEVRAFVQRFIDQQRQTPRYRFQWAVVLPEDGRLIGNAGVRKPYPEAHEAEIGYELNPNDWGHGYATEAARAVVAYGFEQLRVHRVTSWCVAENTASARVLAKVGMQPEGRLREYEWVKGRWHDALIFAILEREWKELHAPS